MSKMNRRRFIGSAAALGLSSLTVPALAQSESSDRPNILIFFGDDMHGGMMSCAGNPHVNTPNMDFLAENGVRFTNAYTTYPLCSPSRASLYSGLLPHQNGVTDNNGEYKKDVLPQVMGHVMSRAGYECHHGGKWHIGNRPRDNAQKIRECGFQAHTPLWRSPQIVNELMRSHGGPEPFLAVIASHAPHEICQFKRRYQADELPDDLPPPEQCPPLPENFGFGNDVPDKVMEQWEKRTEKYESYPKDVWRQYRWYYCRQVEELDKQLGQTLDSLQESGQLENTVIIFTSDHGDGDASHQWQGKRILYEKPIWVPLIVSGPAVRRKGAVSDAPVSNGLDILPTVCDLGGAEPPTGLPGGSLAPFLEHQEPAWRDSVVCELSIRSNIHGRMLRTKRHKYICYLGGEKQEQLFDLQEDPGEMHNLAYEPAHADTLEKHRKLLLDWCRRTDDRRWLEGGWPGVG